MASQSSVVIFMMMKYYLLAILLLCMLHMRCSTAQVAGYIGKEKDALVALKNSFNYPYLNTNWTGPPCFKSEPSTWYGIQCTGFNDIGHVTGIVLKNMPLNRSIDIFAFTNLAELSALTLKNNSLWGNMMDFSLNPKLTHIDLSGNMFRGQISPSLLSLGTLESLQLQDNGFSGPIPWLNQSTLKIFNVSNNNVNGSIPMTQALQAFGYDSYSGNPGLCGKPSPIACNSSSIDDNPGTADSVDKTPKNRNKFSSYLFLLDVAGLEEKNDVGDDRTKTEGHRDPITRPNAAAQEHQTKRGKLVFVRPQHNSKGSVGNQMTDYQIFEMEDLLKASAVGLGKGIFGNSYKAEITTTNNAVAGGRQVKQAVVVKRLRDLKPLVNEEFTKPLQLIANLQHPNLLPLLAYYLSKDEKLLLYKYVPNGNLFNRMFGERGPDRIPFRWSSRLSVARGVAQALEYLHIKATSSAQSSSSSTAPHGNLKSSNVLLDEDDRVLVSDYGFTSLVALPIAAQRMMSYKSPEYQKTKKVSKESDVWSYGSLVLELLTGKISAYAAPPGVNGINLCSWVHRAVREEWTAEIFDMELTLVRRTASSGMLRLLQIAMRCCDPLPEKRPKMKEVVREVESIRLPQSDVDEEEDLSLDPSLTDDSLSWTAPPARVSQ
ncbi:PREDICTED: probable inactive receptor kinase At2g26730 [Prunus mume]|uniref:Probable inactive receptor kinase At2g26730 n=1 Tax=Prunus mume TaxID=102107 RepID=A0ABM0PBK1_PRUMU|nr:PREDICTED: probable inactive receptor kinase At2g26730 [Prunus mume]